VVAATKLPTVIDVPRHFRLVIGGQTIDRGPGSLIYEPYDLVHQWGNPGDTPLTFLTFNINPEGVQAVLPGSPAPRQ
jgi:oxalate decarboxylase/phosphoglucose isomerase-like protein (cupin superfamily)